MSGITAFVLLKSAFTPSDSGRVTRLLQRFAEGVSETRKGRHWTCVVNDVVVSLSVVNASPDFFDFQDQQIENHLAFDGAVEAFVLSFPIGRECDQEKCALLSHHLAKLVGGVVYKESK